jgi:hypothetical protein
MEVERDPLKKTSFLTIYDAFLAKVTDDMYMELTEEDTYSMLQDLLINTLPRFEFPRFDIFNYIHAENILGRIIRIFIL